MSVNRAERLATVRDERDPSLRQRLPVDHRHTEDRPGRRAQGTWPRRIGAARGQRHRRRRMHPPCASSVPTFPGSETRQSASDDVARAGRQIGAPVHPDHPRRVAERRHLAEQLRLDVLPRNEQLDRLDARSRGRLDEILALDREEPGLLPMLARREKLPDEPELLVLTRLDQCSGGLGGVGLERGLRPLGDRGERRRIATRRCPRATSGRARSPPSSRRP